jgi:hypothetical protein
MVYGGEKEGPVHEGITVVHVHVGSAKNACHISHFVISQCGQKEYPSVIISLWAIVFHLDVYPIDLPPWEYVVECRKGVSPLED